MSNHTFHSVNCDNIKVISVPQYESLKIEFILEKINEHPRAPLFISDERDIHKVPRAWLCNIAYTVIGDPFNNWVR